MFWNRQNKLEQEAVKCREAQMAPYLHMARHFATPSDTDQDIYFMAESYREGQGVSPEKAGSYPSTPLWKTCQEKQDIEGRRSTYENMIIWSGRNLKNGPCPDIKPLFHIDQENVEKQIGYMANCSAFWKDKERDEDDCAWFYGGPQGKTKEGCLESVLRRKAGHVMPRGFIWSTDGIPRLCCSAHAAYWIGNNGEAKMALRRMRA